MKKEEETMQPRNKSEEIDITMYEMSDEEYRLYIRSDGIFLLTITVFYSPQKKFSQLRYDNHY